MARVKRGVTGRARHKRVLEQAKGYYGRRKSTIRIARQAVEKAGQYAYRDRKAKKRNFRALWIQRINAGCRELGFTYGQFINGLNKAGLAAQADGSVIKSEATAAAQAEDGAPVTTAAPKRQQPKRQTKAQRQAAKAAGEPTSLTKTGQPKGDAKAASGTKKNPPKPGNGTRSKAQSGQRKGPQRPKSPSKK